MTKYKIVKESNALPEGWRVGDVLNEEGWNETFTSSSRFEDGRTEISIPHLYALLELGSVEEMREWNPRELEHGDLHWKLVQVRLRDVEAQQFKWLGDELDLIDRELGNCHPTKEAAEAWKSKLLAK